MVQPSVKVDHGLVLLVEAEVVRESSDHVGCDVRGPDLLKTIAEFLLNSSLGEARVVAHHIDFLLFCADLFAHLLCAFQYSSLALRLLKAFRVILGEDDSEVYTLVNQSGLNQLEC